MARGPKPPPTNDGGRLYRQAGCQACHGLRGEGTKVGPAIAGHSVRQVIRQVRTPLDRMPAYDRGRLSDSDLARIAAFVASRTQASRHVEPVSLQNLTAMHHWMALGAIDAGNVRDALHHVGHIVDRVKGTRRAEMKRAERLLRVRRLHEAEHVIARMLAGRAKPKLTLGDLRLELALAGVDNRDRSEALHQVRHFMQVAKAVDVRRGREVLTALKAGDLHDARHALERLLGRPSHG